MYHTDGNDYLRSAAPQAYIPGRTPGQQAARAQANSDGMDALAKVLWSAWYIGPIVLAGKAGFNWHELTGDKGAAAERGAQALARWKWFQVGVLAITGMLLLTEHAFGPLGIAHVIFWTLLYVRLAEFSLFRRGPIQWAMTPITRALDNVHTWAIVLAALLPLVLGLAMFNPSV